jgi:hypothetical protein
MRECLSVLLTVRLHNQRAEDDEREEKQAGQALRRSGGGDGHVRSKFLDDKFLKDVDGSGFADTD